MNGICGSCPGQQKEAGHLPTANHRYFSNSIVAAKKKKIIGGNLCFLAQDNS
jgi:hypothetical protein